MKRFNLSNNIRYVEWTKNISDKEGQFIHVKHIQEFINILKEDLRKRFKEEKSFTENDYLYVINCINEIAGVSFT
jgi:hypothetical protein